MRLLQITDLHLHANKDWSLSGVQTQASFEQVLELALTQNPGYDLGLFSGDLVHDASKEGYLRLLKRLNQLEQPSVCLPGNHDQPDILQQHLNSGKVSSPKLVHIGQWQLVLLDSTVRGSERGLLRNEELDLLQQAVSNPVAPNILICLHHHPIPVGSQWMDRMALQNPDPFFEVIDRSEHIRGILWGHVHQTFEHQRGSIKLMGTPSTCLQFTPNQDSFGIDPIPPGYRWLELHSDGKISSAVERIDQVPSGLDIHSGGY